MSGLGDSPVTLDIGDPVERALAAVAVEIRGRRSLMAEWDARFDVPVAVLLDLLDDLEAAEEPPGRSAVAGPPEVPSGARGPEAATERVS